MPTSINRDMLALRNESKPALRRIARSSGRKAIVAKLMLSIAKVYDGKVRDDTENGWVTINGAKFQIKNGEVVTGPQGVRSELNHPNKKKNKVRTDQHGRKWEQPTRNLPKAEYSKVTSEIDIRYNSGQYKGQAMGRIVTNPDNDSPACTYIFEIHEYEGDYPEYNIIYKRKHKT